MPTPFAACTRARWAPGRDAKEAGQVACARSHAANVPRRTSHGAPRAGCHGPRRGSWTRPADAGGRTVTGASGLTCLPTARALDLDGHRLHTWCALDAAGIRAALGVDAARAAAGSMSRATSGASCRLAPQSTAAAAAAAPAREDVTRATSGSCVGAMSGAPAGGGAGRDRGRGVWRGWRGAGGACGAKVALTRSGCGARGRPGRRRAGGRSGRSPRLCPSRRCPPPPPGGRARLPRGGCRPPRRAGC